MVFITSLCFKELLVRQFRCVRHWLFFTGNSRLNCRIIESIFNMSLVYLYTCTCTLVQSFMSRTFAASNFPSLNLFDYLENFLLRISLSRIFEKDPEFFA